MSIYFRMVTASLEVIKCIIAMIERKVHANHIGLCQRKLLLQQLRLAYTQVYVCVCLKYASIIGMLAKSYQLAPFFQSLFAIHFRPWW